MCFAASEDQTTDEAQGGYQDWYVPGPYTGASVKDPVTVENLPSPSQAAAIQAAIAKNEANEAQALKDEGGVVNPTGAVTMYGSGDPKLKSSWSSQLPETWLPDPGTAPDVELHPDSGWRQDPFRPNDQIYYDGGDTRARVDMGAGGHGIQGGERNVWMGNYSNEFSRDMDKYWTDPSTGLTHDTSKEGNALRAEQQRSLNENPDSIEIKQRQTQKPDYNLRNRRLHGKDTENVVDVIKNEAQGGDDGDNWISKFGKLATTVGLSAINPALLLPWYGARTQVNPTRTNAAGHQVKNPLHMGYKDAALASVIGMAPTPAGWNSGQAAGARGALRVLGSAALGDDAETVTGGTMMKHLTERAGPLAEPTKKFAESIGNIFGGTTREKGLSTTLNMTAPQQQAMGAHFNKAPNTPFGENEADDFYDRQDRNDRWLEQARWDREQRR